MTWTAGRLRWLSALVVACAACPTSAAASPTVTEFTGGVTPGFTANAGIEGITMGLDGNIWFAEAAHKALGRVNPNGTVTEFPLTTEASPEEITVGSDGNIWFTEPNANAIARRNPDGSFTEFKAGVTPGFSTDSRVTLDITRGSDGNIWFTRGDGTSDSRGAAIARLNLSNGTVTEFKAGISGAPNGITAGPDGNIWIYEVIQGGAASSLARLNPNGTVTEFTPGATPGMGPGNIEGITAGPDGNIWYTKGHQPNQGAVGRLNPGSTATEFYYPSPSPSGGAPDRIKTGCDGNLWFTEAGGPGGVGRLNPDGTVTEFLGGMTPGLSANDAPRQITTTPDAIWFSGFYNPGRIVRITSPPGAVTGQASAVSRRSATLQGTVRPCGQPTVYSFEYGTSTGYGNATAPTGVPGVLFPIPTAMPLSRLRPDTVYHYRLDATNHSGTAYGVDRTFRTAPVFVIGLGAFPPVFAAEKSGPSANITRKRHRGTTVRFRLNEAANVRFTVTKQITGRKAKRGKKKVCAKPTHKNRKHRRCKRTVTLKGSFTINGVAGKNHIHFTGRLNGHKLPPGKYRLVATPITGGVKGKSTSTAIRIIR